MDLVEDNDLNDYEIIDDSVGYYTLRIPVNDILRLKFKAETGHEFQEDYIDLEVEFDSSGYVLYSINNKFIIYNDIISLTNQRVTENSLRPFGIKIK